MNNWKKKKKTNFAVLSFSYVSRTEEEGRLQGICLLDLHCEKILNTQEAHT